MAKRHDWRGGSKVQHCGNVGCSWVRLPSGVEGDARVHYMPEHGDPPVLKARPCQGKAAEDLEAEQ